MIHRAFAGIFMAVTALVLFSPGVDAVKPDKDIHPQNMEYGKIVAPGKGQGIGGVIGPVSEHWEMVCLEDGFCINILNTGASAGTGGLGHNKVKLMAYTLREAAAQLNHVAAIPDSAITSVRDVADTGFELGMAMIALEQCYVTEGCRLRDAYEAMIDPGYRNFVRAHQRYHRYVRQHPDVFRDVPEVPRLVDYQAHGIAGIIEGVTVAYDPIDNEMQLKTVADLTPQDGREICRAIAGQSACRLLLPR